MRRLVLAVWVAVLPAPLLAQVRAGGEIQVNTYITGEQLDSHVALDASGRFTVNWLGMTPSGYQVFGRRFAPSGTASGGEFQVNSTSGANMPVVSMRKGGAAVSAWWSPAFGILAQRYDAAGAAQGAEFRVNTSFAEYTYWPSAAPLPGGGFVVAWTYSGMSVPARINTRRFDAQGTPLGGEVLTSQAQAGVTDIFPSVSAAGDGAYVAVWKHSAGVSGAVIQGRRFDAAGNPGPLFQVSEGTALGHCFPRVSMAHDGSLVAVWTTLDATGREDVHGRMFTAAGTPAGPEFAVNQLSTGFQRFPSVASGFLGDFVVTWSDNPALSGGNDDVMARRFNADGTPRGPQFKVNTFTSGSQAFSDVATDAVGNFVISWDSPQDGSASGVYAQRFGGLVPAALRVDTGPSSQSDGNGVLEPGETVDVRPFWQNVNGAAQAFTGTLFAMGGPPGATYTVNDGAGDYLTVPDGATFSCSDCYAMTVSAPAQRPLRHWDTWAREQLAPDAQGQLKFWYFHVGDTFGDVPRSSPYYRFVETLIHNYVTAGCTDATYCPQAPTTREQMAVFVVVSRDRAGDPPPLCTTPLFNDVPASSPYCAWIEELAHVGVVTGCGGGNFCPTAPVTREQMAVFVLRTLDPQLSPPSCTTPVFADVPASSPYCRWIEELARRGVVTGCGGGNYCPGAAVTREQMAVFLTKVFGLSLYGP